MDLWTSISNGTHKHLRCKTTKASSYNNIKATSTAKQVEQPCCSLKILQTSTNADEDGRKKMQNKVIILE